MARRLSLFFVSLLLILPLTGCDFGGSSPKSVAQDYTTALVEGHPEKAWDLISADDRSVKDKQSFLDANNNDQPLRAFIANNTSSKITKVTVDGNKATATIETTMPDISGIMAEVFSSALANLGKKDPNGMDKDIAEKAENAVKSGNLKETTVSKDLDLVKEDGKWRVFLHWREKKEKEAREAKIKDLLAQGKKAIEAHDLDKAETAYAQIRAIEPHNMDLDVAEKQLTKEKEKVAYFDKIDIYDFKAKFMDSVLYGRVPGVDFKIRNAGDRTLNRVEVTVYFKDKDGNIISEDDYLPVFVSEYNFTGDNKPLKPGYIWRQERGKFFSAKNVPDEWKEGAAEIKVTDLEFADDK